jgi:hypothetical protein
MTIAAQKKQLGSGHRRLPTAAINHPLKSKEVRNSRQKEDEKKEKLNSLEEDKDQELSDLINAGIPNAHVKIPKKKIYNPHPGLKRARPRVNPRRLAKMMEAEMEAEKLKDLPANEYIAEVIRHNRSRRRSPGIIEMSSKASSTVSDSHSRHISSVTHYTSG